MSPKLVEVVRLNGSRAGCHDRFSSCRPVGGEVFYLDSPFIEPTIDPSGSTGVNTMALLGSNLHALRISSGGASRRRCGG